MMTTDDYRQRTAQALAAWAMRARQGEYDLSKWPADVVDVVQAFCGLWSIAPPTTKNSKKFWIAQARELLDACGEFGVQALQEYRDDFERYMHSHGGVAPHIVTSPASLVNMVRAQAGKMRAQHGHDERDRSRYSEWEELGR